MNGSTKIPTRKEREKSQRQQEIFHAAKILFAKKGFGATTMDDISKQAELAKGTLYNFFGSKSDLFVSLISSEFNQLLELLDTIITSELEPLAKLNKLIFTQLDFFENNRDFFKLLSTEAEKISTDINHENMTKIKEKHFEYYRTIAEYFTQSAAFGMYKNIEPSILAHALVGMIKSIALCYLNPASSPSDARGTLTDKTDLIASLFLSGAEKK